SEAAAPEAQQRKTEREAQRRRVELVEAAAFDGDPTRPGDVDRHERGGGETGEKEQRGDGADESPLGLASRLYLRFVVDDFDPVTPHSRPDDVEPGQRRVLPFFAGFVGRCGAHDFPAIQRLAKTSAEIPTTKITTPSVLGP